MCSFTNISFRFLKLSGNSNHLDYSARHFDFLFSSAPAIKTDLFPLGGFLNQPLSVTLAAAVMFMQSAKWKYTQVLTVWGKLLIKHRHFPQTVKTVVLSQGY